MAVFGVDVAFACHFVAINRPHPCRSACDIGYASENSKWGTIQLAIPSTVGIEVDYE